MNTSTQAMFAAQQGFDVRVDWGMPGLRNVAALCPAVVLVDVLSFSTCVDIACERGAAVWPYPHKDESAAAYAEQRSALLAGPREQGGFSLSPSSLRAAPAGLKLVLPSPNGSALARACHAPAVIAGCLRNASAVASALSRSGDGPVAIIAAGEQWPDGTLRVALEDLIGAGAIVHSLLGSKSPEALAAEAVFLAARDHLHDKLTACASGRELIERGYAEDVRLASQLNASSCVPRLVEGAFRWDGALR
ncbi:2-phosphosulfolactate phosphatase [Ideonella sp. DXS29W]|uniref:Probable 2-phosphosulfolactate phosphatase n=1 Tax=Ideonella lacteola TaxID=2984193 RepID=A0ABU9BK10_9BURK